MKFLNISNHPSANWPKEQFEAAASWGEVVDIPFPNVPTGIDRGNLRGLVKSVVSQVYRLGCPDDGREDESAVAKVMVQGEAVVSAAIAFALTVSQYKVVAAKTERVAIQNGDTKTSVFKFAGWREYEFFRFSPEDAEVEARYPANVARVMED